MLDEDDELENMLADIEDGIVGCVIVKDMSRIGRNYLEVGFYTEVLFRKKNVRLYGFLCRGRRIFWKQ